MLKNYFKVAFRSIFRHRAYSIINIIGLTLGITVFTLLWLFIDDEVRFNSYHTNYSRIYRLYEKTIDGAGEVTNNGFTSMELTNALVRDFPQIENKVNLFSMGQTTVTVDERSFVERDYLMADPSIFKVFDFQLIEGTIKPEVSVMAEAVLTKTAALKYFDRVDVSGEMLDVSRMGSVEVIAVIEDIPSNSDLQADIIYLCNFQKWPDRWPQYFSSWDRFNTYSFILFENGANPEGVLSAKESFLKKYLPEKWRERDFYFQPLSELHLRSGDIEDYDRLQNNKGNIQYVYIFIAIGVFVLLIACINYINLATARSFERLKEVGIRKTAGATKAQLVTQFLTESILISLISMIIAIGAIEFVLPMFNAIAQKDLELNFLDNPSLIIWFLSTAVMVGVISGFLPALYIIKYTAVRIFRGAGRERRGIFTRKGLVILQFTVSMVMIVATVVVYRQLDFVRSAPLGFRDSGLLTVDINSGSVRRNFEAIKAEFERHPAVKSVSVTSRVPGEWKLIPQVEVKRAEDAALDNHVNMHFMGFDEDAMDTFEFSLESGTYFSGASVRDSLSVLINQSAAKALGFSDPIGKEIIVSTRDRNYTPRIIGVVSDFHFQSFYEQISPMVLGFRQNPVQSIDYFTIKFEGNDLAAIVNHAKTVHGRFDENNPIEYHFLEDQLSRFYQHDELRGQLFGIAAVLAIVIACLGLFGLASFTAQQRTKEFGIRKVLGANIWNLIGLMSGEYVRMLVIAFVIATPLSWFFMDGWLSDFAYRMDLSWSIFIISALAAFVTAIVTVAYKSWRTAITNPVESLRYE